MVLFRGPHGTGRAAGVCNIADRRRQTREWQDWPRLRRSYREGAKQLRGRADVPMIASMTRRAPGLWPVKDLDYARNPDVNLGFKGSRDQEVPSRLAPAVRDRCAEPPPLNCRIRLASDLLSGSNNASASSVINILDRARRKRRRPSLNEPSKCVADKRTVLRCNRANIAQA